MKGGAKAFDTITVPTQNIPSIIIYDQPEWIGHISVVERVDGYLCDNVGQGHHQEGELDEDQRVDERVETESEQRHQTDAENNSTQLYVTPVDHIEHCTYVDVCMKGQR